MPYAIQPNLARFFTALFALLAFVFTDSSTSHAQVKGKIIVTNIDAGGNGDAYGQTFIISPPGRLSTLACPRPDLGSTPTGLTQCTTTYGSSDTTEWQPGDVLTVRVKDDVVVTIPVANRPSPNIYYCVSTFKGFTGACQGMGTHTVSGNLYECQFTLPSSGDVQLGVQFAGSTAMGDSCPPLSNPATPVPTVTSTPNPQSTPTQGDLLYAGLSQAADALAEQLRISKLLRGIAKFIIPKTAEFTYDIKVTVNATGTGTSPALSHAVRKVSLTRKPLISSALGKSSKTKTRPLTLSPTSIGKTVLSQYKSLQVKITASALKNSKTVAKISVTKTIH